MCLGAEQARPIGPMDAYGGRPGTALFKMPAGIPANLGTNLSGDHPISIAYDSALAAADGGLHDPAAKTVPDLGNKSIQEGMLINGKVECSSCHDVHKSKGYSPSSYTLLLVNNEASGLCLTCHNK
jgi:predicted CXXCH cytochrome family protein